MMDRKWQALVFGGLLRDLMVFGLHAIPRDVDLVIQRGQPKDIESEFLDYITRRTRFGGYVLGFKGWRVDIWPLWETWAIRQGLVGEPSPTALTQSTFLNVEAVALTLDPQGNDGRIVYDSGFFEGVQEKLLDINLEPNPYPELSIVRSLMTASKLDFALSPRLVEFIDHQSGSIDMKRLLAEQVSHYGAILRDHKYLSDCLAAIRDHMSLGNATPLRLPSRSEIQLDLLGSANMEMMAATDEEVD
jgi:hypothetical protein